MSFENIAIVEFLRESSIHIVVWSLFAFLYILEIYFPAIKRKQNNFKRIIPNFTPMILIYLWIPVVGYIPYMTSQFTVKNDIGILNYLNIESFWIHLAVAFLVRNLGGYINHLLHHRVPFLWNFHSVHHADDTMDVINTWRFHLAEITINILLLCPYILLTGVSIDLFIIYDFIWIPWNLWSHANISIPKKARRFIEVVFFTPDGHRVHHSSNFSTCCHNYGSIFNIWDRLFSTYKPGFDNVDNYQTGVKGNTKESYNNLWKILFTGFKTK